ncbi:MAG TPA: adenylate/guanylate cyclase domain-containing protein [Bradyrhizobium sp.]|nr:adenylate/guanylate cyclase domain-containing protein [Bradyrhizobium sp.]
MDCSACGVSNPSEARYCGGCGAALVLPCAECGKPVPLSNWFCGNCGARFERGLSAGFSDQAASLAAPVHLPQHLARRILDTRGLLEGERKQITVLFADIKGSTNLIEDLDPEDAESRLRPALDAMINAVHRYEGTINRVQGDGIMALFGAPLAHEDNSVRAAYAALDMQKGVRAACNDDIAIRVGLHSGEVLVRAINNDLSVDYDAIGPTVHLAARMEQMATAGAIYCTANVMRMAKGFIEAISLGEAAVKGIRHPVALFQITGHTAARTRWEVTAARGLTPFIGRTDEAARLQHSLELADAGQGQVIAVKGEAGTGKSRLVHEFLQSPRLSEWTVLKTSAAPYLRGTPYLAVSNLLRAWCQIPDQASADETRIRLHQALAALPAGSSIYVPALESLLELAVEDADWPTLEPAVRRLRMRSAVKDLFLRCAQHRPLLLWFEDMQWADVETHDVVESLVEAMATSRLLVVLTCRPEYEARWDSKDCVAKVHLDALESDAAGQLVRALLGDGPANAELRALIVARTGGTPLFIEETVRSLIESGALRAHDADYELTRELKEIQIPETVQSVIAARIDRLNPKRKTLLQMASVIGADIPLALLRDVLDVAGLELQKLLGDLQAAHFLIETASAATAQWKFTHALIHEVAYGGLISAKRQMLHARVLHAMELQNRANPQEVVESLAHHAFNAADWAKAASYLSQAGDKAVELSAYQEAGAFFEQALQALKHLPQDHERIRQGIDVRLKLRPVFGATANYNPLEDWLADAEVLATSIEDRPRLAAINVARVFVHNWRGELDASIECGLRARNLAREIGDREVDIGASFYLGQAYMWRGDFRKSVAVLEDNLGWIDGPLRHQRMGTTGTGSVLWQGMLGASHARLGNFEPAIEAGRKACAIADEVRRPFDVALAYWWAGFIWSHKGDVPSALQALEHGFEVCRASQINYLVPILSTSLGYTYALAGRLGEGIPLLARAVGFSRASKFTYGEAWSSVYLGFANLLDNRYEGMLDHAEGVLELARKYKYRAIEADALRLLAQIHRDGASAEQQAERHYLQASEICLELGLRPEYARCQIGLGETLMRSGREAKADRLFEQASGLCRSMGMLLPDIRIEGLANLNSV